MANRSSTSYWVFILILVVLHLVVHVAIGFGTMAPDLITIAVLLSARRLSGAAAAGLGLALGLLVDALSLTSFRRRASKWSSLRGEPSGRNLLRRRQGCSRPMRKPIRMM